MTERIVRNKRCTWAEDDNGTWKTGCGNHFIFEDGIPSENGARFCCYCGGVLTEKRYTAPAPCGHDGGKD